MEELAHVATTPLGGTAPPIDLSVYGLFIQADWVVKSVMIALLLASFWSWAIIFEKMIRLRALKRSAQSFEDTFWSGVSLEDLYDRVGAKRMADTADTLLVHGRDGFEEVDAARCVKDHLAEPRPARPALGL